MKNNNSLKYSKKMPINYKSTIPGGEHIDISRTVKLSCW